MPRNSAEPSVPDGTVKTSRSNSWPSGAVAGQQPDEHHGRDEQDEPHRDDLDDQQRLGPTACRDDDQGVDTHQGQADQQEGGPLRRRVPHPDLVQELDAEDAGGRCGHHAVEGVRAQQGPAGDHAGPGAQGGADEAVDRAGVVELLGQAHERVRHQQHAHGGQGEGERDRPADRPRGALRVDVGGHRRRHQGDRDADGLPDVELAAEPGRGARGVLLPGCPCAGSSRPCPRPYPTPWPSPPPARCGAPGHREQPLRGLRQAFDPLRPG